MAQKRATSVEELKNVYFLYGDEELLAEEALQRLKDLFSREVDTDFNVEMLDASETGAEQIIDSAETVPLLASKRLVIVRNIDRLSRKDAGSLAEYLSSSNPATTLVLVSHFTKSGEQKDSGAVKKVEGTAVFKAAKKSGEILKLSFAGRGRQEKINTWVNERFRERGKKCEPAARALLVEKVGTDLRELSDAIERVCLYCGDGTSITLAEMESVVAPTGDQGIFDFVDAVAERRRDLALYLFNRLLRQGENPQRLFNMLLRQFRLIAKMKSMDQTHDYAGAARAMGVHPFVATKCAQQSRRYSPERLRSVFGEFKKAQLELHSSKYLGEREYQGSVLELMIVRIIG